MKDEGMANESKAYVLDTSAILTLLEAEDGADIVRRFIRQAIEQEINLYASVVSLMEVCYISLHERGKAITDQRITYLQELPMIWIQTTTLLALEAGQIKAKVSLSLADAWIAATAKILGAELIHKDPEFESLKDDIQQIILPYKI